VISLLLSEKSFMPKNGFTTTEPAIEETYPFDQRRMITHATDADGLCGSLSSLFIQKLLSPQSITEFQQPNYSHLYSQAKKLETQLIDKEKDGECSESLAFDQSRVSTTIKRVDTHELGPLLTDTKAALVKYRTKSGAYHQLAFGLFGVNRCVLFNPNVGTNISTCSETIRALQKTIEKSTLDDLLLIAAPR
jgi:hypothetical protein